jgi:hypothetical protein
MRDWELNWRLREFEKDIRQTADFERVSRRNSKAVANNNRKLAQSSQSEAVVKTNLDSKEAGKATRTKAALGHY